MDVKRATKILSNIEYVGSNRHPPSIQVSLTDKCFNQCGFCEHWKRNDHNKIDVTTWLQYIASAANRGLQSVCYVGGDAMAYPNLNAVLIQHKAFNVEFGFITTGYVPPTVDLDLLKEARWIRCSLDAVSPDIYDSVRGGVKIEKVKDSIEKMVDAGCNVEFYSTLHNGNWNDAYNIAAYALKLGVNMAFTPAEPGTCEIDLVDLQSEEMLHLREKFKKQGLNLGLDMHTGDPEEHKFNYCSAVYYQLYIEASGDVYPCCHIAGDTRLHPFSQPLGNIRDGWYKINEARHKFACLTSEQRPGRCHICGDRFQTINHIVEKSLAIKEEKQFY